MGASTTIGTAQPQKRWPYRVYLGGAIIFSIGVLAQAFFAGAGIFMPGPWMNIHIGIGHLLTSPIPLIPLIMLIMSFVGKLSSSDKWLTGLFFFLALIQPVFLYVKGLVPLLAAFHPVNALLIFALPLYLIYRIRVVMREPSTSL